MENRSGHRPIRDLVLVKPDEDFAFNKGGVIQIPDNIKERHAQAQTYGVVVAMGPTAFLFDKVQYGVEMGVKPGDRVQFSKYGGIGINGTDGDKYRLIADGDITAFVDEDVKLGLS